jgi:hypothetical protein
MGERRKEEGDHQQSKEEFSKFREEMLEVMN